MSRAHAFQQNWFLSIIILIRVQKNVNIVSFFMSNKCTNVESHLKELMIIFLIYYANIWYVLEWI